MMAKRAARASWNVDEPPIALQPSRSSESAPESGVWWDPSGTVQSNEGCQA